MSRKVKGVDAIFMEKKQNKVELLTFMYGSLLVSLTKDKQIRIEFQIALFPTFL